MCDRSLWCGSVNQVLCSDCKVQNSPVCNKTELRSKNGIPLHSTDSASPGGRRNAHPCAHLHKQFLLSNQRRTGTARKWSIILEPSLSNTHQVSTPEVSDHWRSGRLHGILGTPGLYAACDKHMLFSLASFDLMPRTNCVFLLPSFCATFFPPTLQQACRCRSWLSFQNSRSSSVQPH